MVPGGVISAPALGDAAGPDAGGGRSAAAAARPTPPERGCVGAGIGATVGKVLGMERATKSGIGSASVDAGGGVVVGALVVVNAGGDIVDPATGAIVAGTRRPDGDG